MWLPFWAWELDTGIETTNTATEPPRTISPLNHDRFFTDNQIQHNQHHCYCTRAHSTASDYEHDAKSLVTARLRSGQQRSLTATDDGNLAIYTTNESLYDSNGMGRPRYQVIWKYNKRTMFLGEKVSTIAFEQV